MARLLEPIDLSNRESMSIEISRKLLDYLLSGRVQPGQRLPPERKLAEALGVGRSVVREALKSLTLLGLLEVRLGDGTYVKRTDAEILPQSIEWGLVLGARHVLDLIEARRYLEEIIAELAAERRDERAIADLRRLLGDMERAAGDPERFVAVESAFHLRLADAAGNEVVYGIMATIRSLLQVWQARVAQSSGDARPSLAEHRQILEAIEQGDPAAAREAMAAHMEQMARWLEETLTTDEGAQARPAGAAAG
jgi:GntR family transcriptional repressor for pyruvate dehydrogenase complex